MTDPDRVISVGDDGDDVALLQAQLELLGLQIPATEMSAARFGSGTAQALGRLRERTGTRVAESTVVDRAVRRGIDAELAGAPVAAVYGRVTDPTGGYVADAAVRLVNRAPGGPGTELVTGRTDSAGRYLLRYQVDPARPPLLLNVQVAATTQAAPEDVALPCPTPQLTRLDIALTEVAADRPAELQRLLERLAPVLEQGAPGAVPDAEIAAVACAAGVEPGQLTALVEADRLRERTGAPLEVGYALARQQVNLEPVAILRRGRAALGTLLQAAVVRRIIPGRSAREFDAAADQLINQFAAQLVGGADDSAAPGLGAVLAGAGLDRVGQATFVAAALGHTGAPEDFWRALAEQPAYRDPQVLAGLQRTTQLAALTGNNPALVERLRGHGEVRELAALSRDELGALVDDAGLPPGTPVADRAALRDGYVDSILGELHRAFPTVAVASQLAAASTVDSAVVDRVLGANPGVDLRHAPLEQLRLDGVADGDRASVLAELGAAQRELRAYPHLDSAAGGAALAANPVRDGVVEFLRGETGFTFADGTLAAYLAEHPDTSIARLGDDQRPLVVAQLQRLERVYRVAPTAAGAVALLQQGLHSAQQIARVPEAAFLHTLAGDLGGELAARAVHATARSVSAAVASLYATVYDSVHGVAPAAVGAIGAEAAAAMEAAGPQWRELFGSTSYCTCDECNSVLGPAAYLVDLLHYLTPALPPSTGSTPVAELLRRRPDIQYIKLSCANTNTAMPYVDLVNEILEAYIALNGPTANADVLGQATAHDTPPGATAEELATTPAYLNEAAYTTLAGAVFPLTLPYDRAVDSVRTFLPLMSTTRAEVMRTFAVGATPTAAELTAEALGLSPAAAAVIAKTSPATLEECYGLAPGSLPAALTPVPAFLTATALSYLELVELVQTRFVNADHGLTLDTSPGKDPCDLEYVTLLGLDLTRLDRMHRFIRLARGRGDSFTVLDVTLTALGLTELDEPALAALAAADQLGTELGLELAPLLCLSGNIPTTALTPGTRSWYARLFSNPAIASPADPAFALAADGTELAVATLPLADHSAGVVAALRLGADDYAALVAALSADGLLGTTLDLANLSQLYRHVVLARALGVTIGQLLSLRILTGIRPFASAAATADFVAAVRALPAAQTTVAELDDALRAVLDAGPALTVAHQVDAVFRALREGLQAIAEQTRGDQEATAAVAAHALGLLLDGATATQIIGVLDGTTSWTVTVAGSTPLAVTVPAALAARVSWDPDARTLRSAGALSLADRSALSGLSGDSDWVAAVAALAARPRTLLATALPDALTTADIAALLDGVAVAPAAAPFDLAGRLRYLLDRVLPYARTVLSAALVRQSAVDTFGLPADTSAVLVDPVLRSPLDPARPLQDDLLAVGGSGLSASYFPNPILVGTPVERVDPAVDFSWGADPPVPGLVAGAFSVRWSGKVLARADGATTFAVQAGDGVRLTVDGTVLVDSWLDQPPREHTGTVTLAAGEVYDIVLEHYHRTGSAGIQLRWSNPGTPGSVVPAQWLFTADPRAGLTAALSRLRRAALVVSRLGLTAAELSWLAGHPTDFDGFDLNALPVDRGAPATADAASPALFRAWRRIADYAALRGSLPGTASQPQGAGLVPVFAATSLADARAQLAVLGGWSTGEVTAISVHFGQTLADFTDERGPARLARALRLSTRTGVGVDRLAGWATQPADTPQAADVVSAAKARFDEESWSAAAKPLNDALRDRRREALVGYLLPVLHADSPDRLFEHFLIDVEMTSTGVTSRIKQAISSTQLFVQRCLMNLEPTVSAALIDAEQWTWRRNYRVWQANREVFLFPENWIDPALRDDKTPLFRDLESAMLQADLTAGNVETAMRGYLLGLNEVAHLDVCALCVQHEYDGGADADLVHVFARSANEPATYYHRTLSGGSIWSAWQQIPLDISGRELIPVVWNRELRLYWPVYSSRGGDNFVKLAWSVYRDGKWSRRQLVTEDQKLTYSGGSLSWWAQISGTDLLINARVVQGLASAKTGGVTVWPPRYESVQFFREWGRFRVAGCGGAVTAEYADDKLRQFADTDYVVVTAGTTGMQVAPLGVDALGSGVLLPILGRAGAQAQVTTLHPGNLLSPGEVFMYGDERRTYYVRSQWSDELTGQLRDPNKSRVVLETPVNRAVLTRDSAAANGSTVRSTNADAANGLVVAAAPVSAFQAVVATTAAGTTAGASTAAGNSGVGPIFGTWDAAAELNAPNLGFWKRPHGANVALNFSTHYHPYVCDFIYALNGFGLPGVFTLARQQARDAAPGNDAGTRFAIGYAPTTRVGHPYPHEIVDFSLGGSHSQYNWEMFFQAPLMIAGALVDDQQYEAALEWYHYIFNPTTTSTEASPARYWNLAPFHDAGPAQRLTDLLASLDYTGTDPARLAAKAAVQAQLQAMAHDPFNPHHIARLRLSAYQKTVVMKYIDALVGWGDQLFRRDTIEEINQATQLYLLAAALLGPRPEEVPAQTVQPKTYRELLDSGGLDDFSNALVSYENAVPFTIGGAVASGPGAGAALGTTFYFCIPQNSKLLGYWDTVADRLFKIRHGMNIEGVTRSLALFEPRIDPAVLVRAAAAGVDLTSVLADLSTPTPYYRFPVMVERARQLCQQLTGLGSALLAAMEKRDSEGLAVLQSGHQQALLKATSRIRAEQITEAGHQREALDKTQAMAGRRRDFLTTALRKGLNAGESEQLSNMDNANSRQEDAAAIEGIAQGANILPNFTVGLGTGVTFGGQQIAAIFSAVSRSYQYLSASYAYKGARAGLTAGHTRRADEWQRDLDVVTAELDQIKAQQLAADARVSIAEWEADNHDTQLAQAAEALDYLRDKYTNGELYRWSVGQLSTVYFQTYRLAYDLAKQAERAYRFERGIDDSNIIQFGYWNSLRTGLLAGEQLMLAIGQLDDAYHRQNRRELELTRSVSLVQLDPLALIALRQTGECDIELPEALFDADFPGHYLRRIKSASLTIPCVVGPYTGINATLRLLKSRIRTSAVATGGYAERDNDARFTYRYGAVDAVATSHGQRDSGLFEVNFHDDRYLPFEGQGAVSSWHLSMPPDCNAFDFESVTDVVLHLNYTARDGGAPLRDAARAASTTPVREGRRRLFSARQEYPDAWYRFLRPAPDADRQRLALGLTVDRFPYQLRGRAISVTGVRIFLQLADGTKYPDTGAPLQVELTAPGDPAATATTLTAVPSVLDSMPFAVVDRGGQPAKPGEWLIEVAQAEVAKLAAGLRTAVMSGATSHPRLNPDVVHDVLVVLEYTA